MPGENGYRVLVKEKIADAGVDLLREHFDVDVRFRLHRFAAHQIEHGIQCEKTLAVLGAPMTEGRRIVRRLTALLGEVEGLGGHAEARAIEQDLVERAASVAVA